ncbi:amino acid adenylation domain-containing protein [Streptosporangium sp. NBC_01495]|uniref:non-ribosomal peptide synthetase n=1 Tax=Streptosporangium sp. NBC_01495 TaxID=2903899 RepID=UPI002E32D77A|nr:amino acid adenylation domain-containing protein [Streptosporangium sp. NBC_01495]
MPDSKTPLSPIQESGWRSYRAKTAGDHTDQITLAARLRGPVDEKALTAALEHVLEAREDLRPALPRGSEAEPRPVAVPPPVELSRHDASRREEALARLVSEQANRGLDLETGPPVRIALARMADDDHALVVTAHRLVADERVLAGLAEEISRAYEDASGSPGATLSISPTGSPNGHRSPNGSPGGHVSSNGPAPGASTNGRGSPAAAHSPDTADADGATDANVTAAGGTGTGGEAADLAYWRDRLDGTPPALDLPADRGRPAVPGFAGARVTFTVPPETAALVETVAREAGAGTVTRAARTMALSRWSGQAEAAPETGTDTRAVTLAAWAIALCRWSGQDEVVVGVPVPGGGRAPAFPIRVGCEGDPSFAAVVTRVRDALAEAAAHGSYPAHRLAEELELDASSGVQPLYQAEFDQVIPAWSALRLPGVRTSELVAGRFPLASDLALVLVPGSLDGEMRYGLDLFDAPGAQTRAEQYVTLLSDAVRDPGRPVSSLSLLDAEQLRLVVEEWNRTETPFDEEAGVGALFEARAAAAPDALAVLAGERRLTYGELDERANRVAHRLIRDGVRPGHVVGSMTGRSAEALVAFLGIVKSGGVYLPLDPALPPDRLGYILDDSGTRLVLTGAEHSGRVRDDRVRTVELDAEWRTIEAEEPGTSPGVTPAPDAPAYLIYTSGSTGRPKGVEVPHRGVGNLASTLSREFSLTPDDRVALFASLSFDASIWEITMALLNGSALCVLDPSAMTPQETAKAISDQGVTAATFPPTFLSMLRGDELGTVRLMVVAGEQCPTGLVRTWGPGRTFVNAYGPTETTVCATMGTCDPAAAYAPPIGRPLANFRTYVMDRWLNPLPAGVPGELYVGGTGLAHGYRGKPALTARSFMPDPYGPPGARLYRTGDLARYLPDGRLQYVGRVDHQVKIRGFRVEPAEIESAITRYPGVREAVVSVRDDRLVAYVVLDDASRIIADRSGLTGELHRFLQGSLPAYMLPSSYVTLDAMPLTSSGKVDRQALPEPGLDGGGDGGDDDFDAPQTPTEQTIAAIWAEVLKLRRIAREDDFLEIGGHSLVAAQVITRVRERFAVNVPIRVLFENPVLADFAEAVDGALAKAEAKAGAKV